MDFLNLQTTELRAPEFTLSDAANRGTWLSLQLHSVATENSGIIRGCKAWKALDWLKTINISKSDVLKPSSLWHWEGADLHVWGYPQDSQHKVEVARSNGKHGGRPRKDAEKPNPPVNPPENPTENQPDNHKGKGKGKEKDNERVTATVTGIAAADVDRNPLEEPPIPEKKETGGTETWLDVESDEARRVVNRALGRDERRAYTAAEMQAIGVYAGQHDGQICTAHFAALGQFLLTAPRYDSRDQRLMDAVPEGSLLRKRRRFGSAVIEDLPNQIEHALRWAQKKETAGAAECEAISTARRAPPGWQAAFGECFPGRTMPAWEDVDDAQAVAVITWLAQSK